MSWGAKYCIGLFLLHDDHVKVAIAMQFMQGKVGRMNVCYHKMRNLSYFWLLLDVMQMMEGRHIV